MCEIINFIHLGLSNFKINSKNIKTSQYKTLPQAYNAVILPIYINLLVEYLSTISSYSDDEEDNSPAFSDSKDSDSDDSDDEEDSSDDDDTDNDDESDVDGDKNARGDYNKNIAID